MVCANLVHPIVSNALVLLLAFNVQRDSLSATDNVSDVLMIIAMPVMLLVLTVMNARTDFMPTITNARTVVRAVMCVSTTTHAQHVLKDGIWKVEYV